MLLQPDPGEVLWRRCKDQERDLGLSGAFILPPLAEIRRIIREPVRSSAERRRDLLTRKRLYYLLHRDRILAEKAERLAARRQSSTGVSGGTA